MAYTGQIMNPHQTAHGSTVRRLLWVIWSFFELYAAFNLDLVVASVRQKPLWVVTGNYKSTIGFSLMVVKRTSCYKLRHDRPGRGHLLIGTGAVISFIWHVILNDILFAQHVLNACIYNAIDFIELSIGNDFITYSSGQTFLFKGTIMLEGKTATPIVE